MAIADHLHSLAEKMYNEAQEASLKKLPYLFKAERPLVFYYGFSYLAKGTALQKPRLYDQAREYILKYSELGWFSGLDKIDWEEVERFKFFAKANLYTNDLLSGKLSVLPEYAQFLEDNPEELLPGLVTIMETASLHSVNVDDILEKFLKISKTLQIELTILDSCIIVLFTMLNIIGIKILYNSSYCF
ncbi:hypothetical protein AV545_15790 [Paenibacillus jamilae]|uniref:hypothetical protein n=1 Tax=Paenibacillus jamilae TaxID=114136 RepID=UPI0007AB6041|nr:hypothetical protein [Paenibacillus jamilae]KZE72224.1 hypothetical protein AV545_15790 [Paenibacillus jamilae]